MNKWMNKWMTALKFLFITISNLTWPPKLRRVYYFLSYQQANKSKQAGNKHIFLFFSAQAYLIPLRLQSLIHLKKTLQHVGGQKCIWHIYRMTYMMFTHHYFDRSDSWSFQDHDSEDRLTWTRCPTDTWHEISPGQPFKCACEGSPLQTGTQLPLGMLRLSSSLVLHWKQHMHLNWQCLMANSRKCGPENSIQ